MFNTNILTEEEKQLLEPLFERWLKRKYAIEEEISGLQSELHNINNKLGIFVEGATSKSGKQRKFRQKIWPQVKEAAVEILKEEGPQKAKHLQKKVSVRINHPVSTSTIAKTLHDEIFAKTNGGYYDLAIVNNPELVGSRK
jgi:hypothetical protein